jgi:hypothetical protein
LGEDEFDNRTDWQAGQESAANMINQTVSGFCWSIISSQFTIVTVVMWPGALTQEVRESAEMNN